LFSFLATELVTDEALQIRVPQPVEGAHFWDLMVGWVKLEV
jgi:hypothetical protein